MIVPGTPTVMTTTGTTSTRRSGLFSRLRNRMSGANYSTPTNGVIVAPTTPITPAPALSPRRCRCRRPSRSRRPLPVAASSPPAAVALSRRHHDEHDANGHHDHPHPHGLDSQCLGCAAECDDLTTIRDAGGQIGSRVARLSITSSMSTLLLKGGRVIDPSQDFDRVADLWLADGSILGVGPQPGVTADRTLDCTGLIVSPGLIDMHVHLREPGREEDETIATGTAAARRRRRHVGRVHAQHRAGARQPGRRRVRHPARRSGPGTATSSRSARSRKNREGKELAELGGLVEGGAVAFTDDGAPVYSRGDHAAGARILQDVRQGRARPRRDPRADRRAA